MFIDLALKASSNDKRDSVLICLRTPGGSLIHLAELHIAPNHLSQALDIDLGVQVPSLVVVLGIRSGC